MTKYWVGEPLRPSPSLRSQPSVHYLTTNTRGGRDKWGRCLSLTDKSEHDIRIMLYRIKLATNKKQIPTWWYPLCVSFGRNYDDLSYSNESSTGWACRSPTVTNNIFNVQQWVKWSTKIAEFLLQGLVHFHFIYKSCFTRSSLPVWHNLILNIIHYESVKLRVYLFFNLHIYLVQVERKVAKSKVPIKFLKCDHVT